MNFKIDLKFKIYNLKFLGLRSNHKAFTLVEVMVVVALLVVFLGFGATTGGTIRDQLAFFRNQQVVIAQIYRARALAIATVEKGTVCGYGVEMENSDTIKVLRMLGTQENCSTVGEEVPDLRRTLESGGTVATQGAANRVVFVAPIPNVVFQPAGESICYTVSTGDVSGTVQVTRFGQVNTKGVCQ
jgi:prepilin-type N-terminal cleavage/methylation domain-containing protein